ncbi:MAG: hypothetical protein RIN56_02670 [Sporomusaceae bacterium]|nr:hypothetical protein [Sporomusaceae bacterium]
MDILKSYNPHKGGAGIMPDIHFITEPDAVITGQKSPAVPGYVVTLPDKDEILANLHTCYYPPGY